MDCTAWESMIALDVGGDLPSAGAAKLTRHLTACAACRRFAEEMRESQQAVAMMADAPVDDEVLATVRAGVLRDVASTGSAASRFLLTPRVLAVAATIAVALGALLLLPLERPRVTETPIAPQPPAPQPIEADATPAEAPAQDEIIAVRELVETTTSQPRPPIAIATVTAPPNNQAAAPTPAVSAKKTAEPPTPAKEPMVIKLVSEDADLVIYWLVEPPDTTPRPSTGTPKEARDEISAV